MNVYNTVLKPGGYHFFKYNDKVLMLHIDSSRCISIDKKTHNKLTRGKYDNDSVDVISELYSFFDSGYFNSYFPQNGMEDEYQIHEVQLGIHTKCNLRCKYCFIDKNLNETDISYENVIKVIDRTIEKLAMDEKVTWFFFNLGLTGEALTSIDFLERIRKHVVMLRRKMGKNLNCIFANTNGTLLNTGNALRMWKRSDMTEIHISIDGPKEIHDENRCYADGRGSYDELLPFVLEYNAKYRAVAAVTLTGKNPKVKDIFTHLFGLRFNSICIKPIRIKPDNKLSITMENIDKVKSSYTEFINFLIKQNDTSLLDYLGVINRGDFFGKLFFRLYTGEIAPNRCNALKGLIGMDGKGYIYPCASVIGNKEFIIGNIFEKNDNWNIKRLELVKELNSKERKECSLCWARNLCGGGCSISAYYANGSTNKRDAVKCELVRHLSEQAMVLLSNISQRYLVNEALDSVFRKRVNREVVPMSYCNYTNKSPLSDEKKWKHADAMIINNRSHGQIRGYMIRKNLSRFEIFARTLWDELYFYINININGSLFHARKEDQIDENFIRFAITDNTLNFPFEYGLGKYKGKPALYKMRLQDLNKTFLGVQEDGYLIIRRNKSNTNYMAAIPWISLNLQPHRNMQFRFNIVVYSNSHPYGGKYWMEWAPGMVVEHDLSLFGHLKLRQPGKEIFSGRKNDLQGAGFHPGYVDDVTTRAKITRLPI